MTITCTFFIILTISSYVCKHMGYVTALVHFRTLVTLRRVKVRVRVELELRLGLVWVRIRVRVRLTLDLGLGLC